MKKFLMGSLIFTICTVSVVSGITYNKYNNIKKFLNNDKDVKYIEDYEESEVTYNVVENKIKINVSNSSITKRAKEDVVKMNEELVSEGFGSLNDYEKDEYKEKFENSLKDGLDKAEKNIESNIKEEMGLDIDVVVSLK